MLLEFLETADTIAKGIYLAGIFLLITFFVKDCLHKQKRRSKLKKQTDQKEDDQ